MGFPCRLRCKELVDTVFCNIKAATNLSFGHTAVTPALGPVRGGLRDPHYKDDQAKDGEKDPEEDVHFRESNFSGEGAAPSPPYPRIILLPWGLCNLLPRSVREP